MIVFEWIFFFSLKIFFPGLTPSHFNQPGEMVRQARILAQATSDLVNAIKMDAEGESDLENSRKLLSAAKLLADATAKMVEAAKVCICLFPYICLLKTVFFLFFISLSLCNL